MNYFELSDRLKFSAGELDIIVEILRTYNCRSKEILDATWNDYYKNQMLVLHGAKKSCNVIIRDRIILQAIDQLPRIHATKIFPSVNYFKLYRFVKSRYSHLFLEFKKRKKFKVTHRFRYLNVKQFENDEVIRDILHHKSTNSGKYYKTKRS